MTVPQVPLTPLSVRSAPTESFERSPRRRRLALIASVATIILIVAATTTWLAAQSSRFGPLAADPAYIVVNTPTSVTFTAVISDSDLKKHDPKKVLLVRTDSAGNPIDIVGRMNDRGRKADSSKNDHTYTIQISLNEAVVGPIQFRVAAKFKPLVGKDNDGDDDWDRDIAALNDPKGKNSRRDRLPPLLRKLQRYTLSDPIQVTVDPFKLPPDPGGAGKETLEGIDSDHDGSRDDVQRFIAYSYSQVDQRAMLDQYANALQSALTGQVNSVDALSAAVRCGAYVFGSEHVGAAIQPVLDAELNTESRFEQYLTIRFVNVPTALPSGARPATFCFQ